MSAASKALDACQFDLAQRYFAQAEEEWAQSGNTQQAAFAHALFLYSRGQLLLSDPVNVEDAKEVFEQAIKTFHTLGLPEHVSLCRAMVHMCDAIESESENDHEDAADEYQEAQEVLHQLTLTGRNLTRYVLNQIKLTEVLIRVAHFHDFLAAENYDAARVMRAEAAIAISDLSGILPSQEARDWWLAQGEVLAVELGMHETIVDIVRWKLDTAITKARTVLVAAESCAGLLRGRAFAIPQWTKQASSLCGLPHLVRALIAECEGKTAWLAFDWVSAEDALTTAVADYREARKAAESGGAGGVNLLTTLTLRVADCEGLLARMKDLRAPELDLEPDFAVLTHSDQVRESLRHDWEDIARTYRAGAAKPLIIAVGVLLEKLLYLKAQKEGVTPKGPRLNNLIDLAVARGWITGGVEQFGHAVRHHRNLVHAELDLEGNLTAGRHEAVASIAALQMAMRDLGLLK